VPSPTEQQQSASDSPDPTRTGVGPRVFLDDRIYDALIIGGGPGGSAAATYLAKSGASVLVLEKEHFPRFHIGESLLPYNRPIFEEMGVWEKLEKCNFPRKTGAQFHLGNESKSLKFVFREGRFTSHTETIQVERSVFDDILLKHAAECGADVREGWTVNRFELRNGLQHVGATAENGERWQFRSRFLIDASGRGNVTGNQQGLREFHKDFRKVAIFGHFSGVQLDAAEKAGDTVIIRMENKWFWIIPIGANKISVGCVLDGKDYKDAGQSADVCFNEAVQSCPAMRSRMEKAELLGKISVTTDFSYYNRRLVGDRLLRVGDAAGFMDPIFSAGVFLAMYSGKLAAQSVAKAISVHSDGASLLVDYDRRVFTAMKFYWEMVFNFYTTPFMEIFMSPQPRFDIPAAVNAILAGEVDGGWKIHWRLKLFFWLIKLQSKFSIQPRISFS